MLARIGAVLLAASVTLASTAQAKVPRQKTPMAPSAAPIHAPFTQSVDLHSHTFMDRAMASWAFHGEFNGPIEATSWKHRYRSQINPETIGQSGLAVSVVALYGHRLFHWDLREAVRRQIADAEAFVKTNPEWVIAKTPMDAETALATGKRMLVFSLEGADGILENEADLVEFVDQKGLRIVTPLHLTDDQYGGVAFLRGILVLASPWAFIKSLFSPIYADGVRVNPNGLSERGQWLINALLKHQVWVDLSHASDAAQREIVPMLKAAKQPILYTHTMLRAYHGAERGITTAQLQDVAYSGGIVGIMPSHMMMEGTPLPEGRAPECDGHIPALAKQYNEMIDIVGPASVMFGTDFNGGVTRFSKDCPTHSRLDETGYVHAAHLPFVWEALAKNGGRTPPDLQVTARRFVDAWQAAYRR
ncbi:MAG: membrane dipeptidase [Bacteriovoracia bacterium]